MKREEQILFCAARRNNVASICENNFDWFLHGSHDTKYGKGLYGIEKLNKESQHLALLYTLLLWDILFCINQYLQAFAFLGKK